MAHRHPGRHRRLRGDLRRSPSIHVDVERARSGSPFGTTIAHGNLTLSLVDGFRRELIDATGFTLGVNYRWDRIRFPAPVPVDSRVRGRAEVVSVDEIGGGRGRS